MAIFEKQLLHRLGNYRASGLIDSESEIRLRRHLEAKIAEDTSFFKNILYLIGIVFIFTAVAILANYNWATFSIRLKEIIAFVPILFSATIGVFVLKKNLKQPAKEIAALLNIAGVMLMLYLISNTYCVFGDPCYYYLAVVILTLPTVVIFHSGISICVLAIITSLFTGSEIYYLIPLAILLLLFFCAFLEQNNTFYRSLILFFMCMFIPVIASTTLFPVSPYIWKMPIYAGFSMLLSIYAAKDNSFIYNNAFKTSAILTFLISFIISFPLNFEKILQTLIDPTYDLTTIYIILVSISLCAILLLIRLFLIGSIISWEYLIMALVFPAILTACISPKLALLTTNILMFSVAITFFLRGLRLRNFFMLNVGILLFSTQIIVRTLQTDINIWAKAGAFCLAGVILISSNAYLNRRKS